MKFDFSYIHMVYAIMEGKDDVESLLQLESHQMIAEHGTKFGMKYDAIIQALESLRAGEPDRLAQHLADNKDRVFDIINSFSQKEAELIPLLIDNVRRIFPTGNFEDVTVYLIVGYDAIGYGGNIACSIDLDLILRDTRELVSLLIHELTHVIHGQHCPAVHNMSLTKDGLREMLNLLIQYEGVAIFSAYDYRKSTGILENKEGIMRQDYVNTSGKERMLREAYCRTMQYVAEDRDMDTILDAFFSPRVSHALGYIIFENMYKQSGMEKIREMAMMSNLEFVGFYLAR